MGRTLNMAVACQRSTKALLSILPEQFEVLVEREFAPSWNGLLGEKSDVNFAIDNPLSRLAIGQ